MDSTRPGVRRVAAERRAVDERHDSRDARRVSRRVPSYAAFAFAVAMTGDAWAADPPPPAVTPSASSAAAAPAEPASEKAPDIGQRDAWLFGVDNLFGVMQ